MSYNSSLRNNNETIANGRSRRNLPSTVVLSTYSYTIGVARARRDPTAVQPTKQQKPKTYRHHCRRDVNTYNTYPVSNTTSATGSLLYIPRGRQNDGPDLVALELRLPSEDHLDHRDNKGKGLARSRYGLHAHVFVRQKQRNCSGLPERATKGHETIQRRWRQLAVKRYLS